MSRPFFIGFKKIHRKGAKSAKRNQIMRMYLMFIDLRINLRRLYLDLLGREFHIHPNDVFAKIVIGIGNCDMFSIYYLECMRMRMNRKVRDPEINSG